MKISTRTRYGVRFMLDLALRHGSGSVLLRDIAREEDISEKYLSLIVIPLKASGLLKAVRGANGGYSLSREPASITLKEIVECLEGKLYLVDCVSNPKECKRSQTCATRDVWQSVSEKMSEVLGSMTLADVVTATREKKGTKPDYNI
jgi:Rrf2 family protein